LLTACSFYVPFSEEKLAGLKPEEIVARFKPEELLTVLSKVQLKKLKNLLKDQSKLRNYSGR